MYTGLIHLHSLLRWVALLAIIIAIANAFIGLKKQRAFTANDNRWSLITLITFHLQLVIGLTLYFTQGWHQQIGNMSDKLVRFFAVEHLVGMLIVVVLVTVGRTKAKKAATDALKHRRHFVYFLLALLLLLVNIPWPFREVGIGKTWFPGM
jgi:hypothetical protein